MMMTVRLSSCATTSAYVETMQSKYKRRKMMSDRLVILTKFDDKDTETISEIIYDKLVANGLNPDGFSYSIHVGVNDNES